jgi:hypothetical protein
MTPDGYEQIRLRLLQCRAVMSLMRKWAGDEEGDDLLRDGHPANTLQWAADLAVQMIDGALNDLDCSGENAPGPSDQPAKRETA